MRNISLTIICILANFLNAQEYFEYFINSSDIKKIHKFQYIKNEMKLISDKSDDRKFFENFEIIEFKQALPEFVLSEKLLNVVSVKTKQANFVDELLKRYPSIYLSYEDITNFDNELLYYPDDYGSTSPLPNLGFNHPRKDLDLLKAPDAWNITKGKPDIKIGISDSNTHSNLRDFVDKIEFISSTAPFTGNVKTHGSDVAAIAAARGNNSHGSVGVCMDCSIIAGGGWSLSDLHSMCVSGARVINMSWCTQCHTNFSNLPSSNWQDAINYMVDNFDVTFVAASGNKTSYSNPSSFISLDGAPGVPQSPFGMLYVWPASYDNVISVSSIHHTNTIYLPLNNSQQSYCCESNWYPIHLNLEDSVCHINNASNPNNPIAESRSGYYLDQWNPDGLYNDLTLNDKVDILAPGTFIYNYSGSLFTNNPTGGGTSFAAPFVTGTIGLMLSLVECLKNKEIESILKLTSNDIVNISLNQNFKDFMGAGRLDIYESVNFVNEILKYNGEAKINNHKFNRFEFKLERINNNITLENVEFVLNAKLELTAKNKITLKNTLLAPNAYGGIILKADPNSELDCTDFVPRNVNNSNKNLTQNTFEAIKSIDASIFPNPNNGLFDLVFTSKLEHDVYLQLFDINSRLILNQAVSKDNFFNNDYKIDIQNYQHGIYFLKVNSGEFNKTIKVIKK